MQAIKISDTVAYINYESNPEIGRIFPSFVKNSDTTATDYIFHSPANYIHADSQRVDYLWYGKEIVKNRSNQQEVYFNAMGDSIFFLPLMTVGDTMLVYSKGGNWFSIHCDSMSMISLDFQQDSVKFFHLNTNMNSPHQTIVDYASQVYVLSRNQGWLISPA